MTDRPRSGVALCWATPGGTAGSRRASPMPQEANDDWETRLESLCARRDIESRVSSCLRQAERGHRLRGGKALLGRMVTPCPLHPPYTPMRRVGPKASLGSASSLVGRATPAGAIRLGVNAVARHGRRTPGLAAAPRPGSTASWIARRGWRLRCILATPPRASPLRRLPRSRPCPHGDRRPSSRSVRLSRPRGWPRRSTRSRRPGPWCQQTCTAASVESWASRRLSTGEGLRVLQHLLGV